MHWNTLHLHVNTLHVLFKFCTCVWDCTCNQTLCTSHETAHLFVDLFLVGEQHFTSTRWLALWKPDNFVASDQSSQGKSSIVKVPQHCNHFRRCLRHIRFSTWAKKSAKFFLMSKQIAIAKREEIIRNLTETKVWRKLLLTLRVSHDLLG